MDTQSDILLGPNHSTATSVFRCILTSWGSVFLAKLDLQSDPSSLSHFLSQIEVTSIIHNKMPNPPEHEFIIIETRDRLGKVKSLILERTVGLPGGSQSASPNTSPGEGILSLIRQLLMPSSSTPESMEEGNIWRSFKSLSSYDQASLLAIHSAALVSDSLKGQANDKSPAIDQFLGENYVFSQNWHGENVRHLKPLKTLSLFELGILADVVHNAYPEYNVLREQCYFFAGLIYSAIQHLFEVSSSSSSMLNENQDLVFIEDSKFSKKFGRFKGALIHNVERQMVEDIAKKYKEAYDSEIATMTGTKAKECTTTTTTTMFSTSTTTTTKNYKD